MATLFQIVQFFDENGDPLSGGKLNWYEAGTTTPKDTWVDQAESSTAPNPIALDSEGRVSIGQNGIWIRGSYKLVITDSSDVTVSGGTIDNINEYDQVDLTGLTATVADLNSTTTTAVTKTTNYTVVIGDRNKTILVDATSGAVTINLLAAATAGNKYRINIKKIDTTANAVTIDPNASETVDDRTTYVLYDYNDTVRLQCDGSNWNVIASQIRGTAIIESSTRALTLADNIRTVLANASGGIITLTLPALAACARGWKIKIKKTDSSSNNVVIATPGAETIDGAATLSISTQYNAVALVTDGLNWYVENNYDLSISATLPRGYLNGYTVGTDAGDTDHDISFGAGTARDFGNALNMIRASAIVKRIDANWVEGTSQGGFPSALTLTADTWYHLFIIVKSTGEVDAGFDSSITATNLLSDASSYTGYRRIGSVLTNASSNITPFIFTEFGGIRQFDWVTVTKDVENTGIATGTTATTIALRVPPDIATLARFSSRITVTAGADSDAQIYFYPTDTTEQVDVTVTPEGILHGQNGAISGGAQEGWIGEVVVRTNTSKQIKYSIFIDATATNGAVRVATRGWYDNTNVNS